MPLGLIEKLRHHARQTPDRIAIRQIIPGNRLSVSWRDLGALVNVLAGAFSDALPPGAILMLCSANRAEFTAAYLAALAANMTIFPIAPDIAEPELNSAARRCGAAAMLAIGQPALPVGMSWSKRSVLSPCAADAALFTVPTWPVNRADGAALLLLSSGTTGRPKIVRREGASLDAVSANMVNAIQFTPDDHVLAAVPLCHSYGMEHGLLCPIWAGSCAHMYERFDLPAAMGELTGNAVTIFPGVPFMFETLCGAGRRPARPFSLRRAYSAGGPLPRTLFEAFADQFGIVISQLYGASEIGSVTFNDPQINPFDPASVGRPMDGVAVRILNMQSPEDIDQTLPIGAEGHVAIAAPSMLSGYLDGEPPPLVGGYFPTGDLGRLDASGALTITGRIKLLIDVAGRKVNPLEVEEVICDHESVGECVVLAAAVSPTLNRLKAIITPATPGTTPDAGALRDFCKSRLSAYKVPRLFEVRESLPRSPAGKILRQSLGS
ncbi:MAG TPA: class I adenylate-forming enzyme family protein [Tepidisphaeraceae bacterium]|jgi:acyl-CoA synthetase (AMP-forming)/AMP-acid ligase II|nr:class I adenylate-forming enzyme family protein [Tepidisphaeraceae bacterium]